jgi:hypothetical protein
VNGSYGGFENSDESVIVLYRCAGEGNLKTDIVLSR